MGLGEQLVNKIYSDVNSQILKSILPQLTETFFKNNEDLEKESGGNTNNPFYKLSKETKDAISKSDYEKKLYEISVDNRLTTLEMGKLEECVTEVLSGERPSIKFEQSLRNAGFNEDKAKKITSEANEKIFKIIRGNLFDSTYKKDTSSENTNDEKYGKEDVFESREELLKNIENPVPYNNQNIILTAQKLPDQKEPPARAGEPNTTSEDENIKKEKEESQPQPITIQKLSKPFQIPLVKTDHSLVNMSKSSGEEKTKIPGVDPYRELPG